MLDVESVITFRDGGDCVMTTKKTVEDGYTRVEIYPEDDFAFETPRDVDVFAKEIKKVWE